MATVEYKGNRYVDESGIHYVPEWSRYVSGVTMEEAIRTLDSLWEHFALPEYVAEMAMRVLDDQGNFVVGIEKAAG